MIIRLCPVLCPEHMLHISGGSPGVAEMGSIDEFTTWHASLARSLDIYSQLTPVPLK